MLRLLIVDDHPVVRAGLRNFVSARLGEVLVVEAGTGRDGLRAATNEPFDAVLLDICLPDINGLEVLEQLKERRPALPVLVVSIHDEDRYALPALKAGAGGYVNKTADPNQIVTAVETVVAGRRYISQATAERLADTLGGGQTGQPHERLSTRELEVMLQLARGAALTEIGRRLHVSPKTVSTYRARVLEKMGCQSNADLTYYAVKHGLIA